MYVVARDKKSHMTKLKGLLKDADELYLATDEDREGEAIAWHLLDELKPTVPVHRMVFHEITPQAINAAVENPREIDMDLVEAQEARRILDRLYGYEVSPVLWRKVMSGLSAGRVQSVATRLVVDRERERMKFRVASYWDLEGTFDAGEKHDQRMFPARLHSVDEHPGRPRHRLRPGRRAQGQRQGRPPDQEPGRGPGRRRCTTPSSRCARSSRSPTPAVPMRRSGRRPCSRRPAASSASAPPRRCRWRSVSTRTASSPTCVPTPRRSRRRRSPRPGARHATSTAPEYVPDAPRVYASKVKNAQEAHEAIRPAGDSFRTPAQTGLTGDQFRLYELIWMRTIASQMKDAQGNSVTIRLGGPPSTGEDVVFSASGRVITFHGFLKAYVEGSDDDTATDDQETRLPNVAEGDAVSAADDPGRGPPTKPPARYTEATLIKELEEREIGRPSTYASIIGTILNRGYVYKKGTALVPAWLAFSVIRLLEEHFARLVSYEFTAGMEDVLDEIAGGRRDRNTELAEFYFGSGQVEGLKKLVTELGEIDAKELATFPIAGANGSDSGIALRVGKYGPYLEGPGDDGTPAAKKANVPDDLPPDELTLEKAKELLANPAGEEIPLGTHPETGLEVVAKNGRYGPYVTELLPEDAPKKAKPRTGSLFKDMSLETITLEQAVKLLSLPRVVGVDSEGTEITAQNGRYGPYLKKGTDSRSLETEQQLFDITLDEALRIYAQPKQRGRGAAATAPLKELGNDPVSGCAGRGQGGPVRRVRHRRRVQRHPAQGRLRRGDHARARGRAARRAPRQGPGQEDRQAGREEVDRQEDQPRRPRRRPPRRAEPRWLGR